MTDKKKHGFRTTMSHVARRPKTEHGFVNPPLLRGAQLTNIERVENGSRTKAITTVRFWCWRSATCGTFLPFRRKVSNGRSRH